MASLRLMWFLLDACKCYLLFSLEMYGLHIYGVVCRPDRPASAEVCDIVHVCNLTNMNFIPFSIYVCNFLTTCKICLLIASMYVTVQISSTRFCN